MGYVEWIQWDWNRLLNMSGKKCIQSWLRTTVENQRKSWQAKIQAQQDRFEEMLRACMKVFNCVCIVQVG